ncbi:hypothetical protein [Bradymonas sediminis]|uniref:hypothetical protein n=1 Tax=Bradymonas sediminis TaxID=1548548 RepID=UPI00105B44CF|nr:hypothetical protein [Bradymonas sediminis]TDP75825.1 hypothetical protein DFR33_103172 [Bradymonas sediminis]
MSLLKSTLPTVAKLGLAGASICAIAWAFVVYQPDATVRSSQADILDLNFIKLSNTARFSKSLEQLGHDEPQTFLINGNMVNFSVNYSRKHPHQLAREYQDEFVYQGLNTRVWPLDSTFESQPDMIVDSLTGGVVPLSSTPNSVALGGVLTAAGASNRNELEAISADPGAKKESLLRGHQAIQMNWDPSARRSTVTATWSDEKFDYTKMVFIDQTEDKNAIVPSCPDCRVVSRVRSMNIDSDYDSKIFSGPRSLPALTDYYRREMTQRGWVESEASVTFNMMRPYINYEGSEAVMIQFVKGRRFLSITGFPGEAGENVIHTTISD